jgi:hypothetical protein
MNDEENAIINAIFERASQRPSVVNLVVVPRGMRAQYIEQWEKDFAAIEPFYVPGQGWFKPVKRMPDILEADFKPLEPETPEIIESAASDDIKPDD